MSQAITLDQFRQGLSDPNYAIGVIIANNAEDVADNLNNMGFVVSKPQDIVEALNAMLEQGRQDQFVQALSVKVRQDRMSPQELAIIAEQSAAMVQAAGGQAKAFDTNALFAGLATGALTYLNATGTQTVAPSTAANPNTTPPKSDNSMGWVLGGIAVVVAIVVVILMLKKK